MSCLAAVSRAAVACCAAVRLQAAGSRAERRRRRRAVTGLRPAQARRGRAMPAAGPARAGRSRRAGADVARLDRGRAGRVPARDRRRPRARHVARCAVRMLAREPASDRRRRAGCAVRGGAVGRSRAGGVATERRAVVPVPDHRADRHGLARRDQRRAPSRRRCSASTSLATLSVSTTNTQSPCAKRARRARPSIRASAPSVMVRPSLGISESCRACAQVPLKFGLALLEEGAAAFVRIVRCRAPGRSSPARAPAPRAAACPAPWRRVRLSSFSTSGDFSAMRVGQRQRLVHQLRARHDAVGTARAPPPRRR